MVQSVLWLASWYPNHKDPFDGDFIERQAIAVSRFVKVTLLFVAKDELLPYNTVEVEKTTHDNLTVFKYYYGSTGRGGVFEKILSFKKYLQLQKHAYRQIVHTCGQPDIVHVQVAMKAGLLALWLKKKYHIPYVVTEHWSGYYPAITPNMYTANRVLKKLTKKVLAGAALFLPVSNSLGNMVNQYFLPVSFVAIPDVVDIDLFYYKAATITKFRFIHPSSMSDIKNPRGILAACKIVKEAGHDFELQMIGHLDEGLVSLAGVHGISDRVTFTAAVSYSEVAYQMQQSSALIMFSHFETLSCVILEALCCGLPVVSSRVGGIPELIDDENGLLTEPGNVPALAAAMIQLIESYSKFDREKIAARATALFNYETVGRQYVEMYEGVNSR